MSYKALLFCPDEKTARTVTQVLSELDFQVEPCNEPFAAVKKLTAEHFDAVVVDCENEQNAILLFKSARNSASNQASLSIAVVEGQAGVAKAFRIGANLVLTKPINVEQSKGTIRVARGLLRKSESAKAAATSVDQSARPSGASVHNEVSATAPSSAFELEREPELKPEPTEAALLESMPDLAADLGRAGASGSLKESPWQPISRPMASALRTAAEATGNSESPVSLDSSAVEASISGLGAAAAPARQKPSVTDEITPHEIEPPTFATPIGKPRAARSAGPGGSRKMLLIAAVVLLAAAAGYMVWQKTHYRFDLNFLRKTAAKTRPVHQPQLAAPPAALPAAGPAPTATAATAPSQFDAEVSAPPLAPTPEEAAASNDLPASKPKKTVAPIASSDDEAPAPKPKITEANTPSAIVVKGGRQKAVEQPMISEAPAEAAPAPLEITQNSSDNAISGLVNVPTSVPHAAPQMLKVSQGVSQGLLLKKVSPVYPQQALQLKIEGPVQIMATISKNGTITNQKLLSGDPILGRAAMDAVKQWKYEPYYLDGQPVDIQTQITVNFKLP